MPNTSQPTAAKRSESRQHDAAVSSRRFSWRTDLLRPFFFTGVIGLAVGLLYLLLPVAYEVYSFWRANEYIDQELTAIAPYLAFRSMRGYMLLVALGITIVFTALGFLKSLRLLMKRAAWLFAIVLLAELCMGGWIGYKLWSSADRLESALQFSSADFFDLFDLSQPGLTSVREAVEKNNFPAAKLELLVFFQDKFKNYELGLTSREDSLNVMRIADQAVANTFELLTITKTLPADIDWHHGFEEDREWIFFLNRMLWMPALGKAYQITRDPRYARAFTAQFQDWLKDNPLPTWKNENSPSWRLIEAGRRLWDSWVETFQLFIASPEVTDDVKLQMLRSIHDHGQFLTHFRTRFNHLLVESDGLLYAACAFPEFKRAATWQMVAMDRLNAELTKQIYPDGAHAELAFGYHLLCLSHFHFPVKLAEQYPLRLPKGYSDKLSTMIDFLLLSQKPDGRLPLINDTNEMDVPAFLTEFLKSYERPDLLFAATQGAQGHPPLPTSVEFPYSGYYIMRSDWTPSARYLIFDAGSYGGFHGHEDKLSFELSAFGTPMITDGGAYAYTGDEAFRAYFVSTWAHNTVLIDGQGQNRFLYNHYKVSTRADRAPKLDGNTWISAPDYDLARGVYNDGYSAMNSKGRGAEEIETAVTHERRILFIKPDYWIIVDKILGIGARQVEQLYHLTPDAEATILDGHLRATYANGAALQIVPLPADSATMSIVKGSLEPIQGWVATGYNKKEPAAVMIVKQKAELPATFYTVLLPSPSKLSAPFTVTASAPDSSQRSSTRANFTIAGSEWADRLTISRGGKEQTESMRGGNGVLHFSRVDKAGSLIHSFSIDKF